MIEHIRGYLHELNRTIEKMPVEKIDQLVHILHNARLNSRQVFVMGNGGSASTASHFVCDLAKNTAYPELPGFKVIGLTDNMAVFSALGNDHGYENVFVDQLRNFIQPNDVVIAISTSGNSENVLHAVELGNKVGAITIGLTGHNGGKLGKIVHLELRIPSSNIQQIEDLHLSIDHMVCYGLIRMAEISVTQFAEPVDSSLEEPRSLAQTLFDGALKPSIMQNRDTSNENLRPQKLSDEHNLGYMLQIALCSTGASSGTLILLDQKGNVFAGATVREGQVSSPPIEQLAEISQHGLAGWVIKNRAPAIVQNTAQDERWLRRPWDGDPTSSRSAVSVPLAMEDRVLGSITLVHPQGEEFTKEDLEYVSKMAMSLTPSILAAAHLID
ncbi:MAG: SIS domain-containing protein [Chloroflexota bacterium]|jgi:D-sedoheptulose 7-phosphate isomerase